MVRVSIEEVRRTLESVIRAGGGVPEVNISLLADEYLESEMQGKQSHGLAAFVVDVPKFSKPRGEFEVLRESDSALFIDAHGEFGAIVGRKVANLLLKKAADQGIAVAYLRNMTHWLRPATIADYAARNGVVAVVTNTGGPRMVAPPGGREPVIGTNPIGIGIPADDSPVVADMATSRYAWGTVREARRSGRPLPAESFIDNDGEYTTNPAEARSVVAMGAHKGFALGLLIEVLGGAFVDMPMGTDENVPPIYPGTRGATILLFDPEFTVGHGELRRAATEFAGRVRSSAAQPSGQKVQLPGDNAQTKRRELDLAGRIHINKDVWMAIERAAGSRSC